MSIQPLQIAIDDNANQDVAVDDNANNEAHEDNSQS